jgi:hypothetical protein
MMAQKEPKKCPICGEVKSDWMFANCCSHECFTKFHWGEMVKYQEAGDVTESGTIVARIGGSHYIIGKEDTKLSPRGFAGRQFKIKFVAGPHAGKEITTTNLWHQGSIPDEFQAQLPNNAEWVAERVELPPASIEQRMAILAGPRRTRDTELHYVHQLRLRRISQEVIEFVRARLTDNEPGWVALIKAVDSLQPHDICFPDPVRVKLDKLPEQFETLESRMEELYRQVFVCPGPIRTAEMNCGIGEAGMVTCYQDCMRNADCSCHTFDVLADNLEDIQTKMDELQQYAKGGEEY